MYDRRSPIALDSVEASEKKVKKVDVKPFRGCQDELLNFNLTISIIIVLRIHRDYSQKTLSIAITQVFVVSLKTGVKIKSVH